MPNVPTLKQLAARQATRNLNANNMRQLVNSNFPFKYNLLKQSPYAQVSRNAAAVGRVNARIEQHLQNLLKIYQNYTNFVTRNLAVSFHPGNLTNQQKRRLLEVGVR